MFVTLLLIVLVLGCVYVLKNRNLRTKWLSRPIYRAFSSVLPAMSQTERDALEAGTVWWESELFRGKPNWNTLSSYPAYRLTDEERQFMDNEVNVACAMIDDWQVSQEDFDMPAEVWNYLKENRFFSLIIPKEYGGRGFSAQAHSAVVAKLSTRNSALSVSVMVPNSLGPAELLLHYGTDEQKQHYLPRLADGRDIPAFALTSPWAGSDAASIPDVGIVCKGEWEGQEVLGMRVTWDKRYITLAPVCTLLGLAFRLYDPDGLLGGEKDIGITCALVPSDHPGVDTGRRHFPLNAMFMNGPTRGKDVFMPLEFIIGGPDMAGQGWRMLMECLAAGRSISLPSSFTGMAKLTSRAVGGYSAVRTQFRSAISKFEGVEEALARIAGHTYAMDAARTMTAAAVDLGEKPSVVSAIVKYHVTERGRIVVNDGMDVIGGKGICLGPSNFLGRAYQQIPVGITVEGANILTRSLIIFGQGAIRCHPFILEEMTAALDPDREAGLRKFDQAVWAHIRYTLANTGRSFWLGLGGWRLLSGPTGTSKSMHTYYSQASRYSAAFSLLADASMLVLGGSLKMRERLSSRLGDVLSELYMLSAVLKRYQDEGRQQEDAPLAHWAAQDALMRAQHALDKVLENFPNRPLAAVLRFLVFPLGLRRLGPDDKLDHTVAKLLTKPGATRDRLTYDTYLPEDDMEPVGAIEAALLATLNTRDIDAKIRQFEKSGQLQDNPKANVRDLAEAVFQAGGITAQEYEQIQARDIVRDRVIAVDDFPFDLRRENPAAEAASGSQV
ncbi:MAG TPA: acyl-CoA dehydrogenase [Alcaligenes faecalis]|nr:acyl-CoA dehydrogenase [Alcaligenes faecalis]HJE62101.1 acyl-CoA dehydrogenase [Alcaligenes faecalis]